MITQGLNYTSSSYQNDYLSPYSYKVYPTIQYSNNPLFGVNTNLTNFYSSNNYNTYKAITINYYPNNNMSNNNFIQTSYQPSYINITYSKKEKLYNYALKGIMDLLTDNNNITLKVEKVVTCQEKA